MSSEEHGADEAPGWVYDACSGLCLGPASYELAERYKLGREQPMHMNYCGYPQKVIIRPSPRVAVLARALLP